MSLSDREAAGLRGPVARCEAEHLDRHFITRESFRPDGKWTEKWESNPDGSSWSAVRHFDTHGRVLIEQRRGLASETLAFTYDADRRLIRVDERSQDGTERVQESYLYHNDGTSTVTLYTDPHLRDPNATVSVESMLHMSIDAVCIMTTRDSAGRSMKKVLYDCDNRVIRRVLFRYDAAGHLVEEGEVEAGNRLRADMQNLYRYDAQGHCIEVEMHWGAFGGQRKEMSYTELSDLKELRIIPLAGEVDLHEAAPWSTHYTYEYDTQCNWTSRTEQIRLDTGIVTYTGVIRRTLEYWESSDCVN